MSSIIRHVSLVGYGKSESFFMGTKSRWALIWQGSFICNIIRIVMMNENMDVYMEYYINGNKYIYM